MTITSTEAWRPDPRLVQFLDEQFQRTMESYRANPKLIDEHANHEESIRVGGYANRTLLELVQNAADAMPKGTELPGDPGRIEIVLDEERHVLYVANSGHPFEKGGLNALLHAHVSEKRGDEIGRFGLGFKSVLAVSESPEVLSRSVSFAFNPESARTELRSIAPASPKLPILRTAESIDATTALGGDPVLAELGSWATTIVRLPGLRDIVRLRDEIGSFASEFLLFVEGVREVNLRVLGPSAHSISHTCKPIGEGRYRIERPDGTGDDWVVGSRMHEPSMKARKMVGDAVARKAVKISVAVPIDHGAGQLGTFWLYFPLRDKTTATGLFNAPWSVNDDRTTLLENDYNREILAAMSDIYVELIPAVFDPDDPAAHLELLPARGREARSFGDRLLSEHIPLKAAQTAVVPDAEKVLTAPAQLRPLDFDAQRDLKAGVEVQKFWSASPNTGGDVPHWSCYASTTRIARMERLFVESRGTGFDHSSRDEARARAEMPKRSGVAWLEEWAMGDDMASARNALLLLHQTRPKALMGARVIPTTEGYASVHDNRRVFIGRIEGIDLESASFIEPRFIDRSTGGADTEQRLRDLGFGELDATMVVESMLKRLGLVLDEDKQTALWEELRRGRISTSDALRCIRADNSAMVHVPTLDGGWALPTQVFDVDGLATEVVGGLLLDHERCAPAIAHGLGVMRWVIDDFPFEDEVDAERYTAAVLETLNANRPPEETEITSIEVSRGGRRSPGPFSVLRLLAESSANPQTRLRWTRELLDRVAALPADEVNWRAEELDGGNVYRVKNPVIWAIEEWGLLDRHAGGAAPARGLVSPVLVEYESLLPLFKGTAHEAKQLGMPDRLADVPPEVLERALGSTDIPAHFAEERVAAFILQAAPLVAEKGSTVVVPARVGMRYEPTAPADVYVACTKEERDLLQERQRPFVFADPETADRLIAEVGCRSFGESFSFSTEVLGEREPEPLLDVFPGLRDSVIARRKLANATVSRAASITKRVETPDGVESKSLDALLDGIQLRVVDGLDDAEILRRANLAFDLRLDEAEMEEVRDRSLELGLERLRAEALGIEDDAERLEHYLGDDDLKEMLPKGLWDNLEGQGMLGPDTTPAALCLSVYRSDTLKTLADLFRRQGFTDVPTQWAGGPATIDWLRRMGFGPEYAGRRSKSREAEFVVPGAIRLNPLHDYQLAISRQIRDRILRVDESGRRAKVMVELPTGAGKTRVASETVLTMFLDGELEGPVLWIAQTDELCEQAVETFQHVWRGLCAERLDDTPLTIGRLWADNEVEEPETTASVIVATDAKLDARAGRADYDWLKEASCVIIDEGHRAAESTRYTRILTWLGVDGRHWERPLIGLSATPYRGTSKESTETLARRFGQDKIDAFSGGNAYQELVDRGILARVNHKVLEGIEVLMTPEELAEFQKYNTVGQSVLDKIAENEARMHILFQDIVGLDPEQGKSVLVFTPNVLSSQILAAMLRFKGLSAESVSGKTSIPERRQTIERFKRGEIQVLTNCDVLIHGFDAPGVTALYIARPAFSPNAYIQMAGRGLRGPKNGGKEECLIVDLADGFGSDDINEKLSYREYEDLWTKQKA